jgi:hypothetical protein
LAEANRASKLKARVPNINTIQKTKTGDNSAILRRSMLNEGGVNFQAGDAAHHIVPALKDSASADAARKILKDLNIPINGFENGVRLPKILHEKKGLHTSIGVDEVLKELKKAEMAGKNAAEKRNNVLGALDALRKRMRAGTLIQ